MTWTGLLIGALFGAVLQQGRICFNSAFRDVILLKDNYLLKLAAFSIALEMIVFLLFTQIGWMHLAPKPLNFLANIVGGYIFGLGMVLAGGCASGVTYRVGEGLTTAWFAALFYGLTAFATSKGAFSGWSQWIGQFNLTAPSADSGYYAHGSGPTIATIFGINPWIPAVILALLLIAWAFFTKTSNRPTKLNWKLASVLLAVIAGFGFVTSTLSGRAYGLGVTAGWANLVAGFVNNTPLTWEGTEILGIILGAAVMAVTTREFKLRMPKNPLTYVQVALGGALMGFGAVTAGGCNIGHFFTGVPQLAISSIIASAFFVLGNWSMSWFMFMRNK